MPRKIYKTDEERAEAKREASRRYYVKNRDKVLKRTRAWYIKNKARVRDNLRSWRKNNNARFRATGNAYYHKKMADGSMTETRKRQRSKDPEKHRARHRKWSKENPHKTSELGALRRARQREQTHPLASRDAMRAMYSEAKNLTKKTKELHEVDHIIPLSKGGWHHEDNLQPLPESVHDTKCSNPFWIAPHVGYKDWRDVPRELWPQHLTVEYDKLIEANRGKSIRWDAAAA